MPAIVQQSAIPVPSGTNTIAVLHALRNAVISASNADAGRATILGVLTPPDSTNNPAAPSQFLVTNQVVANITVKTTNGDTVTIPTLISLTMTNPVTGEGWFWQAPSTITQQGASTSVATAGNPGVGIVFDIATKFTGGGSVLTAGFVDVVVDFACTINKVTLLGSPAGSVTVDIFSVPVASYSGAAGSSITAADKPTLSGASLYTDTALTGWTTTVAAGTVLRFAITGTPSTTTDLTVELKCTRS